MSEETAPLEEQTTDSTNLAVAPNVASNRRQIHTILWKIAEDLRGNSGLDASEFKNYPMTLIFYKFLSEETELRANELLKADGVTYEEAWEDADLRDAIQQTLIHQQGYYVAPENLYRKLVEEVERQEFETTSLDKALAALTATTHGQDSEQDFEGLFDDIDLNNRKLAQTPAGRAQFIGKMIARINELTFGHDEAGVDVLGDAYEYMISQFAAGGGKTAGEFYTPQEVSTILAHIVTDGRDRIPSIYDPTAGSGSLLLRAQKVAGGKIDRIYGQELNPSTYNLARMNMLLHGVNYRNFSILNDNTLTNDMFEGQKFSAIVANPPYSANWEPKEDDRFVQHGGLAPKSKADFAFVQHGLSHLADDGVFACVLPLGVLFRGASEGKIRKNLIEKNLLHAVIALPANIFFGTGIPTCVLVFRKDRKDGDKVLFVDASQEFVKDGSKNRLPREAIDRIVGATAVFSEELLFSKTVEMEELQANEYNCNVKLYVDASLAQEEIVDLDQISTQLQQVEEREGQLNDLLQACLRELKPETVTRRIHDEQKLIDLLRDLPEKGQDSIPGTVYFAFAPAGNANVFGEFIVDKGQKLSGWKTYQVVGRPTGGWKGTGLETINHLLLAHGYYLHPSETDFFAETNSWSLLKTNWGNLKVREMINQKESD